MSDTRAKLPILLIASLCVNAALIGGVATGLWALKNQAGHHGPRFKPGDRNSGPFEERLARSAMMSLSSEERDAFRQSLASEWRESREKRSDMDARRQKLIALLKEDDFNRAEIETSIRQIRDVEMQFLTRMQSHLIDMLENMSADERRAMVEKLESGDGPRFGPPGGDSDWRERGPGDGPRGPGEYDRRDPGDDDVPPPMPDPDN